MRRFLCTAAVVALMCAVLVFAGCNSANSDTDATKIKEVVIQTTTKSNTTYATIPNTGNDEYSPRY